MRFISIIAMSLIVGVIMVTRYCEAAGLHRLPLADEDEDVRPPFVRHYRDYGLLRLRAARADDTFDDYGHLRFGRSDD